MTKIKTVWNKGVTKVKEMAMKVVNGDSHFIAILVAIVVCIALAAVFKNAISTFITNIIGQATTQTTNLFTNP